MEVLVVGAGGREHALAWKLAQSRKVKRVFVAPGNAGTSAVAENIPARTTPEIVAWLKARPVGLVVIGPDHYLADGLADEVRALGIPAFGPSKAAAEIEWSKAFAKELMQQEGIPTARFRTFTTAELAKSYARSQELPLVIKADGLAAGKGVIIAKTLQEAGAAIDTLLTGGSVIIEQYLEGLEVSVHALCNGEEAILFPLSKDYKRIFDGDRGPNTGGMGTIAPVPDIPERQLELIRKQIVLPTLRALKKLGRSFSGLLYPGIMLTKYGPMVIEFNARFGDPETQSYMRLLESDLFDPLYACAKGALKGVELAWRDDAACSVNLAAKGYPDAPEKGAAITLPANTSAGIEIFHAGTIEKEGQLRVAGGRVLSITAIGASLKEALASAYAEAEQIEFNGKQFRRDIGAPFA